MKKYLILSLLLLSSILLFACNKNKVKNPGFKTQVITMDDWDVEIPLDWEEIADTSGMTQHLFVPKEIDISQGTSNVTFAITKTDKNPALIEDMKSNIPSFTEQILAIFPRATDIVFDDYTVANGAVFTLEYQVPLDSTIMKQNQFYILMDNYSAVVTSTDIGDNPVPTPLAVARHITNSLRLHNK